MNEKELLKILNKEKSYTEEDLLLFIYDLRKQNTELKDNWNKLKEWLEEIQQEEFDINGFAGVCTEIRINCILDKMQEIEGGINE